VANAIKRPYGMVLANGPTGSGKTTTLYTMIKKLNTRESSVITIEDPIEYSIPGVTQIPVNIQAGLTFANGLRSILRQDPNIIMVGEIRDSETADIAVNAALTGHLMLSTLHTNDAATTFPRLIDMGVPPFLVASTVNVVSSQRLVRMVCKTCRRERTLSLAEMKSLAGLAKTMLIDKVYTAGKGCSECDNTGYKSRVGIHEVLEVDDSIRSLIVSHSDASQIKQQAVRNGMKTMIEDGLMKAQKGITTIEEVLRIIHE
jgi:type II secretory ATPase GspE/PulE/Tfp pilus assembly ATPase PilB-like protein